MGESRMISVALFPSLSLIEVEKDFSSILFLSYFNSPFNKKPNPSDSIDESECTRDMIGFKFPLPTSFIFAIFSA